MESKSNKNDYTHKKVLGVGASAIIHLYERKSDKVLVAIKRMKDPIDLNDNAHLDEAKLLKRLNNFFVVGYIDHFVDNDEFG